MKSLRQLVGRALYLGYHAPTSRVRDFFAAGGPFEQRRTEAGRREMEAAAWQLSPLPPFSEARALDSRLSTLDSLPPPPPVELHLLTGNRFWYQTAFCLHTFALHSGRTLAPRIYDDGTLRPEQLAKLSQLFPLTQVFPTADTIGRLDQYLPHSRFPFLRDRWEKYPNIRKLTDPHLGSHGWKLVIDSDLLFFRQPSFLLNWLDAPDRPLHGVDVMTSYGYSAPLLASLAAAPLAERLNVGLCGLHSDQLDWEKIEHLCRRLIETERTNYYLEQALVAILLAGRSCAIAPYADYITLPSVAEAHARQAVMHHYVADSKRWYFQNNWRLSATLPGNAGLQPGSAPA